MILKILQYLVVAALSLICTPVFATTYECDTAGEITSALAAADDDDIIDIRAGTYAVSLVPANSGSDGHYITIQGHTGETVIISGVSHGANLSNKSYIKIFNITFGNQNSGGTWCTMEPSGTYNWIDNCVFTSTSTVMIYEGVRLWYGANHNKITNCSFSSACKPADLLSIRDSSYNIIQGNYFGYASHSACALRQSPSLGALTKNIIKNNTFQNRWHHNLEVYYGGELNLIESNLIYDAGGDCEATTCLDNTCGYDARTKWLRSAHDGLKMASKYNIIRKNIMTNNGDFNMSSWLTTASHPERYICTYNHAYNNTIYENYIGFQFNTDSDTTYPLNYNKITNNAIIAAVEKNLNTASGLSETGNDFYNNNVYGTQVAWRTSTKANILLLEPVYPEELFDNISVDPGFTDAANRDFSIGADSDMVDAGAWLTTITSASGSGTSFTVADSYFFMDGWGIVDGDEIQLQGDATSVTVTDVNYSTHTITVDASVTWTQGDGVALAYSGNAPDIGAYEYGGSAPPPPPDPDPPPVNCTTTEIKVSQTEDAAGNALTADARGQTMTLPAGFYSGVVCGFTCTANGNATLRIGAAGASDATNLTTGYLDEVTVAVTTTGTTVEKTFTFAEPLYLSGKIAIGLIGTGTINLRKAGSDVYPGGKPLNSSVSNGWNMDVVASDDKYFKMIGCSGTFAVNTGAAGKAAILFGP